MGIGGALGLEVEEVRAGKGVGLVKRLLGKPSNRCPVGEAAAGAAAGAAALVAGTVGEGVAGPAVRGEGVCASAGAATAASSAMQESSFMGGYTFCLRERMALILQWVFRFGKVGVSTPLIWRGLSCKRMLT